MFQTKTQYDRGVNTFSPEGRLFQVEYAIEAIKLGTTAIGIKTKFGIVLAVEKRITSSLMESSSVEKLMEIDKNIGCAMSGLTADARTLVNHARVECQNHFFTYDEPLKVSSCVQAVCDKKIKFGHGGKDSVSRPYGVALLIAGCDKDGSAHLFHTDPSGTYIEYKAKAVGVGQEGAQSELQENYNDELTLQQAENLALNTLKQVMEEKIESENVQIATVTADNGFVIHNSEYVQDIMRRIEDSA